MLRRNFLIGIGVVIAATPAMAIADDSSSDDLPLSLYFNRLNLEYEMELFKNKGLIIPLRSNSPLGDWTTPVKGYVWRESETQWKFEHLNENGSTSLTPARLKLIRQGLRVMPRFDFGVEVIKT